jgi:hypothetical protein
MKHSVESELAWIRNDIALLDPGPVGIKFEEKELAPTNF